MLSHDFVNPIISQYFNRDNILTDHQISSFDNLIDEILPNILNQIFPICISQFNETIDTIELRLKKIKTQQPVYVENNGSSKLMTPQIARLRNDTYSLTILIDIDVLLTVQTNGDKVELTPKNLTNVMLGKIPIIVGSKYCVTHQGPCGECPHDPGGYVIINGNEKAIIAQEKVAPNIVQVFENSKQTKKYGLVAEVRSVNDKVFTIPKLTSVKITNTGTNLEYIRVAMPHIKTEIPLFIVFRALGCDSDKEICQYVLQNNQSKVDVCYLKLLKASILDGSSIQSQTQAIQYIANHINPSNSTIQNTEDVKYNYVKHVVLNDLLPHMTEPLSKCYYLGYMVQKLLNCYLGLSSLDDRDSYENKRLETCGSLVGNLLYQSLLRLSREIKTNISKEISTGLWNVNNSYEDIINEVNISKIIKSNYIETVLKGAMATGNWGLKNNLNRQGVSQVLNRLTYNSTISHLRRVSTPIDASGKLIPPRKLHNSSWGYICPSETPEGASVGIVKNLAMMCEVTNYSNREPIEYLLSDYITKFEEIQLDSFIKTDFMKLMINGVWLGFVDDPMTVVEIFKKNRSNGNINLYASI